MQQPENTRRKRWQAVRARAFAGILAVAVDGDALMRQAASKLVHPSTSGELHSETGVCGSDRPWLNRDQAEALLSEVALRYETASGFYKAPGFLVGPDVRRMHFLGSASSITWGVVDIVAEAIFNLQAGLILETGSVSSGLDWLIRNHSDVAAVVASGHVKPRADLSTAIGIAGGGVSHWRGILDAMGWLPGANRYVAGCRAADRLNDFVTGLRDLRWRVERVMRMVGSSLYRDAAHQLAQFASGEEIYEKLSGIRADGFAMSRDADLYWVKTGRTRCVERLAKVHSASKSDTPEWALAALALSKTASMNGRLQELLYFVLHVEEITGTPLIDAAASEPVRRRPLYEEV